MKKLLVLLAIIFSLSSCSNHLTANDPIIGEWVAGDVDAEGTKLVLGFVSEAGGELWREKDKKLYGHKSPFIYTRSQTTMKIATLPINGEEPVVVDYTINSLSGSTMSLTDIETKVTTIFTKK